MTLHRKRTNYIAITPALIGRTIFFKPISPALKAEIVDLTPLEKYEIIGINVSFHHISDGMFDLVYIRDDKGCKLSITLNTPSVHLDKAGVFFLSPVSQPTPIQLAFSLAREMKESTSYEK